MVVGGFLSVRHFRIYREIYKFTDFRRLTGLHVSRIATCAPDAQLYLRCRYLALVADAFGERAGALAGDVDKPGIPGDLIKHGQNALRFRQKAAVQIRFKL
jgi:hypothetical protein